MEISCAWKNYIKKMKPLLCVCHRQHKIKFLAIYTDEIGANAMTRIGSFLLAGYKI